MKRYSALLGVMLCLVGNAQPSLNTFAAVTNDWYNANFTNVYELACMRRQYNTNDLVSAFLTFDWAVCFSSIDDVSNAVSRVIYLSDGVTNNPFRVVYTQLRSDYISYRDVLLPTIDENARAAERYKSYMPHKEMPSAFLLRLVDESGLW